MKHTQRRGGLIKLATGIPGFDDLSGGGLPQSRTTLLMGGPGSGKTIFALQTLVAGVLKGGAGILVTFQESPRQIVENAATFGWDLAELEKDKLVILDARIRPNAFKSIELYFSGMLAGIQVVANEMGAKQVVFDSVDTLLSLFGDGTTRRQAIARLRDWLSESGLTAIATIQAEENESSFLQHHGSMESIADCVVRLDYRTDNEGVSRSLRVLKYRGSGFWEGEVPLAIAAGGIEVTPGAALKSAKARLGARANNAGFQREITLARSKFEARIDSLARKLEIQRAELDFLKSKAGGKSRVGKHRVAGAAKARRKPGTRKSLVAISKTS
jgi:circadian clock protein KaiC